MVVTRTVAPLVRQGHFHFGPFDRNDRFQKFDTVQVLFVDGFVRLDLVLFPQSVPNLRDGIGSLRLRMNAVIGHPRGNLRQRLFELRLAFQIGHLQLATIEYDLGNGGFVLGGKDLLEVGVFGKLTLADVGKDAVRLQDFAQVRLEALAVVHDLVAVARNFEPLAALVAADDGDIGQADLIDGLVDLAVSISVVAWEIFSVVSEERSTRSSSWPPLALPDWAADMVLW